ncbi:MAG: regulatory iron-sulfur-containing complex subunit RicT [Phycisphaeraceae bacterium]
MSGSITPLPIMLEDEQDRKTYEALEPPKTIVVRYGYQKLVAELDYAGDEKPGCGSKMVIRTRRGVELGEMLTSTCPNAGCSKSVTRKEMLDYVQNSGGKDYPFTQDGRVLRVATAEDLNEQARLDARKSEVIKFTKRLINELNVDMRLVEVELLLGGERVLFYYTAEDRVDFRELVKRLAAEFQTRIEMCQVNAREEARLVADYEKCGQHCCCKQFLKVLKPVSMRSAKVQKATLDPMKISGRCGRLMCCLRYEDQTYSDLKKRLPHRKTLVETEDGIGIVLDSQILTQLVLVEVGAAKPAAYPVENLRVLEKEEVKAYQEQQRQAAAAAPPPRGRGARAGAGRSGGARSTQPSGRATTPRSISASSRGSPTCARWTRRSAITGKRWPRCGRRSAITPRPRPWPRRRRSTWQRRRRPSRSRRRHSSTRASG